MKTKESPNQIKNHIEEAKVNIQSQETVVKHYQESIDSILKEVKSLKRVQEIDKTISVLDVKKEDDVKKKKELEIEKENIYKGNFDLRDQEKIKKEVSELEDKVKRETRQKEKADLQAQINLQKGKIKSIDQIIKENLSEKDKIQEKINSEISTLDDHKEVLGQNKVLETRNWWKKKKGLIIGLAAGATIFAAAEHYMPNLFGNKGNKDSDKNKTEQTAPIKDTVVLKGGKDTLYVVDTTKTPKVKDSDSNKDKVNQDNKDKDFNKAKAEQEKEIENLRKKNQDLANKLKNTGSKDNKESGNKSDDLEQLRKKLTKTSESDNLGNDYESGMGYKGDVNKTINVVDQRTGKIIGKKTIVEKGAGPETGSQNLTKEEFEKYKNNLVKVGKAEKHETTSQEKITDQKKIDALNKASATLKDAGFSEKDIVENIEKKSDVTLKKVGKAEKHFYINGVELKNSGISIEKPKPGDNYYKHNGYWYEYPKN